MHLSLVAAPSRDDDGVPGGVAGAGLGDDGRGVGERDFCVDADAQFPDGGEFGEVVSVSAVGLAERLTPWMPQAARASGSVA
ncbi:hypothetical protein [Streptomyces sp. NBC_00076]|uniref:hypothetical protein n=1 Tax=Streptomyces sp. NBC_00076 TaxID=2975642 RepID=UPI00324A37C1